MRRTGLRCGTYINEGTEKMKLFKRKHRGSRKPVVGTRKSGKNPSVKAEHKAVSAGTLAEGKEAPAAEQKAAEPAPAADAERVFTFFREIAAIPHGSHHTDAISDYLVSFARERGLSCVQDSANNVIITKKASAGAESADPIALQGHIDMVLASEPDKEIDMLREPVSVVVDGDWMHADGTTLGADNGIAVAMMLAALDDDTLVHPLLECVFTADEEVGLIGASAIDLSGLKSRRLLNLDSEDEGVFCAGCAGGATVMCEMPLKRRKRKGRVLHLALSGLLGGHSGSEIHLGRANANVAMIRALHSLYEKHPFGLVFVSGGSADNAITPASEAGIFFKGGKEDGSLTEDLDAIFEELRKEYEITDPGMTWTYEWEEEEGIEAAGKKETHRVLSYLLSLPNGITQMNPVIAGQPQTSLNMGILRTEEDGIKTVFMVRSGVNSQAAYLAKRLVSITEGFGGEAVIRSSYPAWEYRNDSPFRDLALDIYEKVSGTKAAVEVIHAGLECGILSGKVEGLDCISTGPELENVHTPRERMSISSVQRVWTFVLSLLEAAAQETEAGTDV